MPISASIAAIGQVMAMGNISGPVRYSCPGGLTCPDREFALKNSHSSPNNERDFLYHGGHDSDARSRAIQGIGRQLRVASWNLLRRVGAEAEDVAKLIHACRPDLLLLQEATEEIAALPSLVGGHFFRHPMQKRIYGLAAWSPHAISAAPRRCGFRPRCFPDGCRPGSRRS